MSELEPLEFQLQKDPETGEYLPADESSARPPGWADGNYGYDQMDTIKEIQDEQAHSLFNACMYRDECREKKSEAERMKTALAELARYFTSGNCVAVERATILAKDFWRITGLTPNTELTGAL